MAKAQAHAQAASFGSILDRAPSEIEKPKPLPRGSYITVVVGQPCYDKSSKKNTPYVEFTHKLLSAGEDVDEEELKAMGGLKDKTIKNTYYETEAAAWRLKEFLEHCGIDLDEIETIREGVEATPGKQVGVYVGHEASQDGTSIFARIGKTFVVE